MELDPMAKENLSKRIAGEIVLSENPGKTIQKWRNIFKIPQRRLADRLEIMPSVISDYENGRRQSPGIKIIKRIVTSMIELDEVAGGLIIREFVSSPAKSVLGDVILDMKEFNQSMKIKDFLKKIDGSLVIREDLKDSDILGYTVIDSMKAIVEIPPMEMVKLYGLTNKRALIFIGAHRGRSSMVALKVTNLKPSLVILHGSEGVDDLAKRIGEIESIPIAITKITDIDKLVSVLKTMK